MLLFCVKIVVKALHNIEEENEEDLGCLANFCFGAFLMFFCAIMSLGGHEKHSKMNGTLLQGLSSFFEILRDCIIIIISPVYTIPTYKIYQLYDGDI